MMDQNNILVATKLNILSGTSTLLRSNDCHSVSASALFSRSPHALYTIPQRRKKMASLSVPSAPSAASATSESKCPPKFLLSALNYLVSDFVEEYNDGLNASELEQIFRNRYGQDLDFEIYDFKSMEDFLEQVPDLYPKNLNGEPKVFVHSSVNMKFPDPPPAIPSMYQKIRLPISTAPEASCIQTKSPSSLFKKPPRDAVLPSAKYSMQVLPPVPKSEYIPIFTQTILTPSTIWILLKGEHTSVPLIKMMDEMENLYKSEKGEIYKMLDCDILIGTVGAGIWSGDGCWYRIRILSIEVDYVMAMFVDYGNVDKIPKVDLRYLKQGFLQLPAQAIKSRMAFVAPVSGKWTTTVRDRLLTLCKDKVVMAQIIDCPHYEDTVSLWLCDCTESDDVHINELLVKEGYAYHCDDSTTYDSSTTSSSNQEPQIYSSVQSSTLATTDLTKGTDFLNSVNVLSKTPEYDTALMQSFTLISQPSANKQLPTCSDAVSQPVPNSFPFVCDLNQGSIDDTPSPQNSFPSSDKPSVDKHYLYPLMAENPDNSYAGNGMPVQQPMPSQRSTILTGDCDELFEDDDEDFEKICQEYGCIERYVKRLDFKFGYWLHIVALDDSPYVTSGDVSHLFWPTENINCIRYRLLQNNVSLEKKTVFEEDHLELFKQMKCLGVKGLKESQGRVSVTLFRWQDLGYILNVFGHPSPTIRAEVKTELEQFNTSSDIWKSFEDTVSCGYDDHDGCLTDSDKFMHLCLYDLKSMMDGLRFQKVKFEKTHFGDDLLVKREEITRQIRMYEERIKEIESYSLEC